MSLTQLHPVYLGQALSICHLSSCGIVFRLVDIDASQKERLRWQYKWRRGWLYRQKCLGILIHIIPWFWTCVIHFLVYIWWPDAFALRLFVLIRCIELPVQFCLICIFSMRVQCEVTEEHMFLCNVRKVNGRAQDCAFISVGYQTMENLYQNWLFFSAARCIFIHKACLLTVTALGNIRQHMETIQCKRHIHNICLLLNV